jgi:hypothetical protein
MGRSGYRSGTWKNGRGVYLNFEHRGSPPVTTILSRVPSVHDGSRFLPTLAARIASALASAIGNSLFSRYPE